MALFSMSATQPGVSGSSVWTSSYRAAQHQRRRDPQAQAAAQRAFMARRVQDTIVLDRQRITALLFELPNGIDLIRMRILPRTLLCRESILDRNDKDKKRVQRMLFGERPFRSPQQDRAIGTFLGLVIGDALGAPMEFTPYSPGQQVFKGFQDEHIWAAGPCNRFRLKPGQWTDDASMALCLADSLLVGLQEPPEDLLEAFHPKDLRLRFLHWWHLGYNNAFQNQRSIGLGGNIGESFEEFIRSRGATEYTQAGDLNTSGNGSLMRLAPVPILYHNNLAQAMEVAFKQSKTTHQGREAAECCRLMTYIIIQAMHLEDEDPLVRKNALLTGLPGDFTSPLHSVTCLANSQQEDPNLAKAAGLKPKNRNWKWRELDYTYAPSRAKKMPGYVGSYSMDALAMALHCVWTTNTFEEALLKVVNMGGDADTVGAITGQIAGVIYGASAIPKDWILTIQQWDNGGDIATKAYKLFKKS